MTKTLSRREWLLAASASTLYASDSPAWPAGFRRDVIRYLESHVRPEGAYGWSSDVTAQVTPTFAVVGCYHLLGAPVPVSEKVASFIRNNYPVPERRRTERPLWRLDFEQVQTLLWLNEPVDSFRLLASTWTQPAEFTTRYELGGNPVFQHQAMAARVRQLLGLPATQEWRDYFLARRRPDGTFNNTPASDGTPGHLVNTLWGMLATASLPEAPELVSWINRCRLKSGGFTYAPEASPGAVDDVAYTWAALHLLEKLGKPLSDSRRTTAWLESLQTSEGGFQDRPGGEPNPLATYYALDCCRLLGHTPRKPAAPAVRARRDAVPPGSRVFSIQIEAPGNGSPREAVLLAKTLGVHLWTAKNSPSGWIEESQRIAREQNVPVTFGVGDEEYGTYVAVPGLGTYSHLVDLVAPHGPDAGKQLPKKNYPYPWPEFRDTRIAALKKGGGRMIWQFLENEELTRVLLDEACEKGTYSAISSFHFGNENFLHSQPYLHRWYGRIPFVGLQDAHGSESWWWGNQLAGFTTLFAAKEPTWEAWLQALERNHVMAVRHDAVSGWKTHLAGGSPELRRFVLARQKGWRWWDDAGRQARRPVASLAVLEPGMKFEAGAPASGRALRLRLWCENSGQALPLEPRTELVALTVDGQKIDPELKTSKQDRYYLAALGSKPGKHITEARVRVIDTGRTELISALWAED